MDAEQKANRATDRRLKELEKRIARHYKQAYKELHVKWQKYLNAFDKKDKAMKKQLDNGEITDEFYQQWRINQIGRGKRWESMKDQAAERMTRTNEIAAAYINDATPGIYSMNYNAAGHVIADSLPGIDWTLTDEQTIRRLIEEDDEAVHLYHKLKYHTTKNYTWNRQKIQSQLIQGIIQGESIGEIATRFAKVSDMNWKNALMNARTSVTEAQNAGRQEAAERAEKMGIIVQKEWQSTLDARTRPTHVAMNGVVTGIHDCFPNGLMYPGDSNGDVAEIVNCRCTYKTVPVGFKSILSDEMRRKANIRVTITDG